MKSGYNSPITLLDFGIQHPITGFVKPKHKRKEALQKAKNTRYKKMSTIKETAQAYESPQTKNIADLDKVSVNMELQTEVFKQGTPDEFSVTTTEVDGVKYRVPTSVIAQLKTMLEAKPDMEFFNVVKSGEGMNTKYTVIPL